LRTIKHVWRRDGTGVSGAVTAVMLLLIITSVVSIVMTVFVPVWGEADEAQHMRLTLEQFYSMRENIDAQILRESPITASSKITLGNEPNALLGLYKTTGRLVANPFFGSLAVYNTTDPTDLYAFSRGNVTFTSQNAYIAQQSYIYEQGAILVSGRTGESAMRVPPHFGASKNADGNLSVTMLFVSLGGDFTSFTGTETIILETTLVNRDENTYEGGEWDLGKDISLNLTTPYPAAWARYFNETLSQPLTNMTTPADFSLTSGAGWVRLDLKAVKRMELGVAVVEMRIK
jgi:hypothetical protein